jgi:hypothetical protein
MGVLRTLLIFSGTPTSVLPHRGGGWNISEGRLKSEVIANLTQVLS